MRICFLILLTCAVAQAQNTSSAKSPNSAPNASSPNQASSNQGSQPKPNLAPFRSDGVDVHFMPIASGESSSKADLVDFSFLVDDAKTHPQSSDVLMDEGSGSTEEVLPWDPHKAAKDVEVGDYYFKRKNYRVVEDRYREALRYKDNDAIAIYRL